MAKRLHLVGMVEQPFAGIGALLGFGEGDQVQPDCKGTGSKGRNGSLTMARDPASSSGILNGIEYLSPSVDTAMAADRTACR